MGFDFKECFFNEAGERAILSALDATYIVAEFEIDGTFRDASAGQYADSSEEPSDHHDENGRHSGCGSGRLQSTDDVSAASSAIEEVELLT